MPLTQGQYNDHVRIMVATSITIRWMPDLIRVAIAYAQLGTDQREAALRLLRECYQTIFGVNPTSSTTQRHEFKHWIDSILPGEGIEA